MEISIDLQKIAAEMQEMTDEEIAKAVLAINRSMAKTSENKAEQRAKDREMVESAIDTLSETGQLTEVLGEAGLPPELAERLEAKKKRSRTKLDWSFIESQQEEGEK